MLKNQSVARCHATRAATRPKHNGHLEDAAGYSAGQHMRDDGLRRCRWIPAAAACHDGDGSLLQECAAHGVPDETGDAVADEAETIFMGGARRRVRAEDP